MSLSKTANFNGYTAQGFSPRQQIQLANIAKQLAEQGIPVVISNHDTEFTRHIYQDALLLNFFVQRNISGKNTGRKKVAEILAIFNKSLASKHMAD
ncbi:DNA adenine methylase [Rickettsiella massiliensis]|uniref:DNA adenine methylase n=1 Tax=Rickettsiella massiliensis TaxID=676517 RepID=UPI00029B17D0|nr:DNA adenine methylase [Rickettsiella massiliensis]